MLGGEEREREREREQAEVQEREVTIYLNGISIHLQPDGISSFFSHTTSHHTTEDLAAETKHPAGLPSGSTPSGWLQGKKNNALSIWNHTHNQ